MFNRLGKGATDATVTGTSLLGAASLPGLSDGSLLSPVGQVVAGVGDSQQRVRIGSNAVASADGIVYSDHGPPRWSACAQVLGREVPFADVDMVERRMRWHRFVATKNLHAMAASIPCGIDAEIANLSNQAGETALIQAAAAGEIDLVLRLLRVAGICVNWIDQSGETALSRAAEEGHADVVTILLKHPGIEQHYGKPLKKAAMRGDLAMFHKLLRAPETSAATLIAMAKTGS